MCIVILSSFQFTDMSATLRHDNPEVADRLTEVTRLDRQIRDQLNVWVGAAERLLSGKANKAQFADIEKNSRSKVDEWKGKIEKLVYGV